MGVNITQVETNDDINAVATLARAIWTQHFTPIIGASQVDHMLSKFQSAEAIEGQIADGWEYYLIGSGDTWYGYTGLVPDTENSRMLLSKLYLLSNARGKGLGKALLGFIENISVTKGCQTIWLTVNRFNDTTIAWYKRRGFVIVDEVKKDIGDGFFMDDFIMEKQIHA